ncbi:MAG: LacI family DNA-binding transcriptional regulator [Kiritimatiellales bacterium]
MENRFTLQNIADRCGYAKSTVSMAMRNHPGIPAETREKILRIAKEMGYRPNPLVGALMTQLRCKSAVRTETIALLNLAKRSSTSLEKSDRFYVQLFEGIRQEADASGLKIDEFVIDLDNPMPGLSRILLTRGIHGLLIFSGGTLDRLRSILDLSRFAAVHAGFGEKDPIHQVVSDYIHNMDVAFRVIQQEYIKKIGFAVQNLRDDQTNFSMSSRFLHHQRNIPVKNRIPFITNTKPDFSTEEFLEWIKKYTPEVILIAGTREYDWLKESDISIPGDCRVINLVYRKEPGIAGVNPQTDRVGRAAVSLLLSLLQNNQIGLPEFPQQISIQGDWVPGESFPQSGN